MKCNDWDESLSFGGVGEKLFISTFKGVFEPVLHHVDFSQQPDTQRAGVDVQTFQKPLEFDVKSRDYYAHRYKDILVETISVVEKNKPGWVYYTRSDYIVYVWFNKTKTRFVDGYLIDLPKFKPFFEENITTFEQPRDAMTKHGYIVWHTRNKAVPIYRIPQNCIKHIDTKLIEVRDQTKLSKFFDVFDIDSIEKQTTLSGW